MVRLGFNRLHSGGRLIAWSQRRCVICQRFLSLKQKRYCSNHGSHKERNSRYYDTDKGKESQRRYYRKKVRLRNVELGD